ncbi:adhesion G-protein coupled receptor G6-like isoform X2 [Antedon mediterranea]|uniref:adhesion G-protein coupled receptor G6-like isoform X2 n=1 Tax=Antedon mediterranea TaxID=105859 RepID=UPI003AF449E2
MESYRCRSAGVCIVISVVVLFQVAIGVSTTSCDGLQYQGLSRNTLKNWKWTSNLSLNYKNWGTGDPNFGNSECAGALLSNGKFLDLGCDEKTAQIGLTYIYEFPIENAIVTTVEFSTTSSVPTTTYEATTYIPTQEYGPTGYIPVTEYGPLTMEYQPTTADSTTLEDGEAEDELTILRNTPVTTDNVEDVSKQLEKATETASPSDNENTITASAYILEEIVSLNSTSSKVTTAVAATVNNLLESSNKVVDVSDDSRSASSTVVQSLEEQLSTVASAGLSYNFSRENLNIEVVQLQDDFASNGIVFYSDDSSAAVVPFEKHSTGDLETSLTLPAEVYDGVLAKNETIQGVFVYYKESNLFPVSTDNSQRNWKVASGVISATLHGLHSSVFNEPVVGVFTITENISVSEDTVKCVYWDFELQDGIGDWSDKGCHYNSTKNGRVNCHCNHLTNFAVLVDHQGQTPIDSTKSDVLTMLSLIGCFVSLIALILTIFTQIYMRCVLPFSREQHLVRPRLILINFAISLFFLYLIFVVGIDQTDNADICVIISGLLHYFTISSLSWMTVQAVNIYVSLVRIFPTYVNKFKFKAYVFGWGFPLIPVVTSLCLSIDSYSTEHYCFLKPGPVLYFGNLAVIGVLFLNNFIIFILVIRVILCSNNHRAARIQDKGKITIAKEQAVTAIGLSILLGLTWIFGFAVMAGGSSVKFYSQLLFCIFNSFQGLFVFLFFAVRTGDLKQFMCCFLNCLICRGQSYRRNNRYEIAGSHDTAGDNSAPMTNNTDV